MVSNLSALDDRKAVLEGFARGECPPAVFGVDRPFAALRIASFLYGIAPSESDRIVNALTSNPSLSKRLRAFDNGRKYLFETYYEYGPYRDLEGL